MCGLFGGVGKEGKRLDVQKIKLLGLGNLHRGRDSCGYFHNNTIKKGAYLEKAWDTFLEKNVIEVPDNDELVNDVFIGHVRSSTVGYSTEANAHPFLINDSLVLAHNGTLENAFELCNKYGINHKDIHVDSLALGHLIDMIDFSILDEYRGYAALAMHKIEEPGVLYLYHGLSRLYKNDSYGDEERPLFFMNTDEALYYSSVIDALLQIRANYGEIPQKLKWNTVCRFDKGIYDKDADYVINRLDNNIGLEKKTIWQGGTTKAYPNGFMSQAAPPPKKIEQLSLLSDQMKSELDKMKNADVPDIYSETYPPFCYNAKGEETNGGEDSVFSWKGRHYMSNNVLCQGIMFIDKTGLIYESEQKGAHKHYFYKGVKIDNEDAYNKLITKLHEDHNYFDDATTNFALRISKYSKYPVLNLPTEGLSVHDNMRYVWFFRENKATKAFTPLFGDRHYNVKDGVLKEIKSTVQGDIIFTKSDRHNSITIYANRYIWMNGKKSIAKDVVNRTAVIKYSNYFRRIYTTLEDIENMPQIVYDALNLYVQDLLGFDDVYLNKDQEGDVAYKLAEFLTDCVNQQVCIKDNMDAGIGEEYIKYLDEAISEEQRKHLQEIENALPANFASLNEEDNGEITIDTFVESDKKKECV